MPMILIVTAQELRKAVRDPICDAVIDESIAEIERDFVKPDSPACWRRSARTARCTTRSKAGTVCPGHSIEAALVHPRGGPSSRGRPAIWFGSAPGSSTGRWRLGGTTSTAACRTSRDARGSAERPNIRHDLKLWWPHNEAIIAHAPRVAPDAVTSSTHAGTTVHDWAYAHFPDPESRRVVRVPAPRRERVDAAQGQHVERPVPPAANAVVLLRADSRDARRGNVDERTVPVDCSRSTTS